MTLKGFQIKNKNSLRLLNFEIIKIISFIETSPIYNHLKYFNTYNDEKSQLKITG